MGVFDDIGDGLDTAIDATGKATKFLSGEDNISPNDFAKDGFIVPPIPSADGNGLPSQKSQSLKLAQNKRALIHWFVPEFGVVKMYVNPSSIRYSHKKVINKERTKGGFMLQYWGEDLSTLSIGGTTGSSGIEGINVLYEIYRSEQLAFDAIGLTLASDNAAAGAAEQIAGAVGDAIGGDIGSSIVKGLLGTDSAAQALAPRNIPSLAQFAFGIELFYLGWVYRGYFDSMTVNEDVSNLGLFAYDIQFVVTERRGYRFNNLPWQKSAIDGPSGQGVPLTFGGLKNNGNNR